MVEDGRGKDFPAQDQKAKLQNPEVLGRMDEMERNKAIEENFKEIMVDIGNTDNYSTDKFFAESIYSLVKGAKEWIKENQDNFSDDEKEAFESYDFTDKDNLRWDGEGYYSAWGTYTRYSDVVFDRIENIVKGEMPDEGFDLDEWFLKNT